MSFRSHKPCGLYRAIFPRFVYVSREVQFTHAKNCRHTRDMINRILKIYKIENRKSNFIIGPLFHHPL